MTTSKSPDSKSFKCCLCGKSYHHPLISFKCCNSLSCKKCFYDYIKNHKFCPKCGNCILNDQNMCTKHGKPYEYKCENCNTFLCSECLFDIHCNKNNEHKDHKISKVTDLHNEVKNKIDNELQKLREMLKTIKNEMRKIAQLKLDVSSTKDIAFIDSNTSFRILQKNITPAETLFLH